MRIAHVMPPGEPAWTGVFTVIVQLSAALARRRHDVELWQHEPWDRDEYAAATSLLEEAGVTRTVLAGRRGIWSLRRAARRTAASRRPDVVHLHSVFIPANNLVAWAVEAPYAVSVHGAYDPVALRRSPIRKATYRSLVDRWMLRRARLVCALTEVEAGQLRAAGAGGRIVVVPNGVEPPILDVDASAFRRELGVPDDRLFGVFVGRIDAHHKGLDLLIRGLSQAPEWVVAVVGPDERRERAQLERLANTLGVSERLHFAGRRDRRGVHVALAAADLFLLASRWEGMPVALLEALSHGTPALVTPPVQRAVPVAAAGAGWVTEPDRLGAQLRRLASLDASSWRAAAEAARELASGYSWDAAAARYECAYRAVLDRPEGRPPGDV